MRTKREHSQALFGDEVALIGSKRATARETCVRATASSHAAMAPSEPQRLPSRLAPLAAALARIDAIARPVEAREANCRMFARSCDRHAGSGVHRGERCLPPHRSVDWAGQERTSDSAKVGERQPKNQIFADADATHLCHGS